MLAMVISGSLILSACGEEVSQQATAPVVPIASEQEPAVDLFAPQAEEAIPEALPQLSDPVANDARTAGLLVLEAHLQGDASTLESMKGTLPIFSVDDLLSATDDTAMYQVMFWDNDFIAGLGNGLPMTDYFERHEPVVTDATTLLSPKVVAMLLSERPGDSLYLFDGTALAEGAVGPVVSNMARFLLIGSGDTWTVQAI